MTFSIAARCADTGAFGCAIASSSICVAARCIFARPGVGAALTQNVTDPRLGPAALDAMADGLGVVDALVRVARDADQISWRQLAAVDAFGGTAHYSGARVLGLHAVAEGQACIAAGNLLANPDVPAAMVQAFGAAAGALADRLVRALEAGLQAGGEEGPVHSAGLLVVKDQSFPLVDLRVDWSDEPIAALRALWTRYAPEADAYRLRALDPDAAPGYDVPGDDRAT